MNPPNRTAARFSEWSYQLLLAAYPPHFRQEYGGEMRQVFLDCWRSASGQGNGALLKLWRRVLLDLILTAPREYLAEWQQVFSAFNWRQAMNMPGASYLSRQPGSWRETLWALIPYGLLILIVFLPVLLVSMHVIPENWVGDGGTIVGGGVILAGVSLVSLVMAWRKGWPRWSASWLIFWVATALSLIVLALRSLDQPDDGSSQALPGVVVPFVVAWLVYRLACRNPIAGLLGILPFAAGTQVLIQEYIPSGTDALLNIAILTMICLVATATIRSGSWRLGFWLCAGLILAVSGLAIFASQYLIVLPPEAGKYPPIPAGQFVLNIVVPTVGAFAMLIGPFLARAVRELGMKSGKWGQIAYRVALLGIVCLMIGAVIGPYAFSMGQKAMTFWTTNQLGRIFVILGVFLYVAGIGALFAAAIAAHLRLRWIDAIFIVVLPGMLPLFFGLFAQIMGILPPFLQQDSYFLILIVCLGLVWWGFSYWLVTHFEPRHAAPQIAEAG